MNVLELSYPRMIEIYNELGDLALADFARRGISPETTYQCRIEDCLVECLTPPQQDPSNRSSLAGSPTQWKRLPREYRALKIPYFRAGDVRGIEVYRRFRFLGEDLPPALDSLKGRWKPVRYLGNQGEIAKRLYVCPLLLEKWPRILQTVSLSLMLVEGELEAVRLIQGGYRAIAIGGVWMGTEGTKETGFKLIKDFSWLNLKGRTVLITFDSDREEKWQIRAAETRLSSALRNAGALPKIVKLQPLGGR
ncbi:MAG: DUF3854 domain-containing protein [Kovacikia sp.]